MAEQEQAKIVDALKKVASDPMNKLSESRKRLGKGSVHTQVMPRNWRDDPKYQNSAKTPNGPKKDYKGTYIGKDENKGLAVAGKHKGKYAGPDKYMGLARGPKRKALMEAAMRRNKKGTPLKPSTGNGYRDFIEHERNLPGNRDRRSFRSFKDGIKPKAQPK